MKEIIFWEVTRKKKYIFWWTIAISLTVILILSIYPPIRDQFKTFNTLIKQLPASFINLKTGGASESMVSPIGWLNSQIYFVTLPILFLIMSIGLGSSILSNDEKEHTMELVLARPISRTKLLLSKLLSYFIIVAIPWLIASIVTSLTTIVINLSVSQLNLFITDLWLLFFVLVYGLIGFSMSAVLPKTKRLGATIATIIAFLGYLLTSLASLNHYMLDFAKLLPWYYYSPSDLLAGKVNPNLSIYLVALAVVTLIISFVGFNNRDLS